MKNEIDWKHLLYIIPICCAISLAIGINYGVELGIDSVEVFEEMAFEQCNDGLDLCIDMVSYLSTYNGTTDEAFASYAFNNTEKIKKIYEKYE